MRRHRSVSHVNHLALVERVRRRCLAARETSVVSSDLTTRTPIRTFEVPRYDDVSSERIRFGKPVTEAECEYTSTEKVVKRNFSTTFSCTFPRGFVEKFVES